MNKTYINTASFAAFLSKKLILAFFLVFNLFLASTVFGQNGPNCPSGICIGPGVSFTSGSLTVTSDAFYSNITIKPGETLTVKSGVTLYVGQVGTGINTQVVDFQNGCAVVIESGASLIVNGLLNNSNNSNGVSFDGSVSVTGNVTSGNGSTIVGSGTLNTTGSITTSGTGSIFGSTGECNTGPCSGGNLCSFTGSISSNQTICSNATPATLTSTTGASSPTYQWQSSTTSGGGFTDIVTNGTNATYVFPSALTQTTYYRLKIKSICTVITNQIAIVVNPILPASVSISASANSICSGTSVTFTATPTNGGTTPTYQWYKGVAAISGATSATYTSNSLVNNDVIKVVMTSNATCPTGSPATSNTVTMVVSSAAPATPGAITGSVTQCAGTTSQVYSVSPVTNATSYDWHIPSGWVITSGLGTNSITVTVGTISDNVYVNAINTCGTGYASGVGAGYKYVTVNPIPSAPGTASSSSPTCTGFTAQWAYTNFATKYFLDVATDNGFASIVPAYNNLDVGNVTNYALTGLNPGTIYYYRVRAYSSCGTSANSATMTYATTPVPTVAPVASAASSPDCTAVTVNWSTVANATGYYLDIATDNGFTSFVSGYNGYNIAYSATSFYAAGLPSGTLYYRLRGYNSCGVVTANSNTISFSTTSPIGGTVSSDQTICSGTSPANLTLSGYSATNIIYWEKSSDAAFSSPTNIAVTTATLSGAIIGNLTANTYFRAVVQNQFGSWCTSNSNSVLITVTPSLSSVALTLTGSPTVCLTGTGTSLSVAETVGVAIASRQWGIRSVSGGTITPIGGETTSAFTAGTALTAGTYIVVCTSTSDCGVSVVSNEITVTVNQSPSTPGSITGSINQCAGNTSQVYSIAAVAGATSYNWSLPANWSITAGANTNSITVSIASNGATGNVSVNATNSCGTSNSVYQWVVVSTPTVAGTLTPANTNVCSGSNYTNLTLSGNTGGVVRWESSTDNFATAGVPIVNTSNSLGVNNLTTDTYFRAVVQNGGCNLLNSASVKITVSPAMAAPGGISVNGGTAYPPSGAGISYCANTSTVFSIAPVANATSYTWVIPTGWTLVGANGTNTVTVITGTNPQSANIEVYASNTGCGNTSSSYLYLYLNPSTAPQVALVQPTCAVATGTITVTSPAPASGITYTLVGTNPVVAGVTNTTGVFSGLAVGTYDVTINNGSFVVLSGIIKDPNPYPLTACASTTSATISALATNTWTTSWSNGTPTADQNIVFNAGFSSTADVQGCSCTVTNGAVVFNPTHTLKITNWVHVNGGSLTFENNASLVQINNVPNTGNIKYFRTTNTIVLNTDYTYWSSPVSPQTIGSFSSKTKDGMVFSYDSSIDDWKQEYLSTSMVAGVGYIVRGPEPLALPPPPSTYTVNFVGVPNNGNFSFSAIADKSYLLGNPYPSAIDADKFLIANAGVLNGTLYFWTHKTQIGIGVSNPGSGVYAYSSDDYATYNATGGVGAAPPDNGTSTGAAPSGGAKPNGFISAGQGFFASTLVSPSGSPIVFNNSMRVVGTTLGDLSGINQQFFKTRNPKTKTVATEKHRIWLDLTNTQGAFKQTLIGYVADATDAYDSRFDGESYDGNEFVDFYSVNLDKNLTIQGRALPFNENDEVPLGFRSAIDGAFTINIDEVDGLLVNQSVFLEDKLTNTITDLKSGNYTFNTTAGTFNERFVLKYSSKTLGVDTLDKEDGILVFYSNNYKKIIIRNNGDSTINSVSLFSITGQNISVWDVKDNEQTNLQLPIKDISSGIYIVKVKTTNGESSKKIIVN